MAQSVGYIQHSINEVPSKLTVGSEILNQNTADKNKCPENQNRPEQIRCG